MARYTWGDRVRDMETGRLGTVLHLAPHQLLVLWDEPLPHAKSPATFVAAHRCEVLPSWVRGLDGRLRRGLDYHLWRAGFGAPFDYRAALAEEAALLIDQFYGR